jgi:hypothetical protein
VSRGVKIAMRIEARMGRPISQPRFTFELISRTLSSLTTLDMARPEASSVTAALMGTVPMRVRELSMDWMLRL